MFLYGQAAQLFSRRCACALAVICLWFSAGVVLHHTDQRAANFSQGQTLSGSHQAQLVSDDPCAACEWEKAVPTLPLITVAPSSRLISFALYTVALTNPPLLRTFDHFGLRAPPLS